MDRSIVIKPVDKGFCLVVSNRKNYLDKAKNHLIYFVSNKEVKFVSKSLVSLVDESTLKFKKSSYNEFKYFSYNFIIKLLLRTKCTCCRKSIKDYLMYQVALLFLWYNKEKHQNFYIRVLNVN